MLFFTSDGDLKRKNSRTAAPFWPQRDLSVVGSRVDASGQRPIGRNLTQCFFSGENHSYILRYCRSRERGTSWSRKLNSLRPKIRFFPPKGLVSGAIKCSQQIQFFIIAHWLASRLVFSWTSKYRGWRYSVEWRTDGMLEWNTRNILEYGICGIL